MDRGVKADVALCELADSVARRGLITPVILVLELFKPFSVFGSQALLLVEPLLGPRVGGYAHLLEDSRNVERLVELLEARRHPNAD